LSVDECFLFGFGGFAHGGEFVWGVEGGIGVAGVEEFLEVGVVNFAALGLVEGADLAGVASENGWGVCATGDGSASRATDGRDARATGWLEFWSFVPLDVEPCEVGEDTSGGGFA